MQDRIAEFKMGKLTMKEETWNLSNEDFGNIKLMFKGRLEFLTLNDISDEMIFALRHMFRDLSLDFIDLDDGSVLMTEHGCTPIPPSYSNTYENLLLGSMSTWGGYRNKVIRLDPRYAHYSNPQHELFFNCFRLRTTTPQWNDRVGKFDCLRKTLSNIYNVDVGDIDRISDISDLCMQRINEEDRRFNEAGHNPRVLITLPEDNEENHGHIEPYHEWRYSGYRFKASMAWVLRLDSDFTSETVYLAKKVDKARYCVLKGEKSSNKCKNTQCMLYNRKHHGDCHLDFNRYSGYKICYGCNECDTDSSVEMTTDDDTSCVFCMNPNCSHCGYWHAMSCNEIDPESDSCCYPQKGVHSIYCISKSKSTDHLTYVVGSRRQEKMVCKNGSCANENKYHSGDCKKKSNWSKMISIGKIAISSVLRPISNLTKFISQSLDYICAYDWDAEIKETICVMDSEINNHVYDNNHLENLSVFRDLAITNNRLIMLSNNQFHRSMSKTKPQRLMIYKLIKHCNDLNTWIRNIHPTYGKIETKQHLWDKYLSNNDFYRPSLIFGI